MTAVCLCGGEGGNMLTDMKTGEQSAPRTPNSSVRAHIIRLPPSPVVKPSKVEGNLEK